MKKTQWLRLGLVCVCCLLGVACSLGGLVPAVENSGATQMVPATATRPAEGAQGDADLLAPARGLSGLTAYQQRLEISLEGQLNGQPYHERQVLLRTVQGQDVALQVQQETNDGVPVWLFEAQRQGYAYVQQTQTGVCRAVALSEGARPDENLAERVPAVLAMQLAGNAEHGGQAALRYTFDQQSLAKADGALQSAQGEVLLAQEGGVVLSYQLTAQVQAEGFSGTRSWVYDLQLLRADDPLPMPASCLPVLSDVPIFSGAKAVEHQPGFLAYRLVGVNRPAVVEFYAEQLPVLGWQALPGAMPDQTYFEGESTAVAYRRADLVLIVSLFERDGALQVVAQTVALPPIAAADAQPAQDQEPSTALLPPTHDLPILLGSTVLYETETTRVLQANLPLADVVDFYTVEMEQRGWVLSQKLDQNGMNVLLWTKDELHLAINIVESDGVTTITLAAYTQ